MVGRIGPAHGLRGEVFVEPRTDEPERRFAPGAVLRDRPDGALTVAGVAHPLGPAAWSASRSSPTATPPRPPAGTELSVARRRGRAAGGPRGVLRPPARRAAGRDHRRRGRRRAGPHRAQRRPGPARDPYAGARGALPVRDRARARGRRRRVAGSSSTTGRASWRGAPDAHRRRLDLPRVPRPARALPARQGPGERPARRTRPRPARLDPRPAPHRRRHPLRRRRGHGDEARAVGRGARRGRARRRRARRTHARRDALHPGRRRRARRRASTWSSRAGATRASTSG